MAYCANIRCVRATVRRAKVLVRRRVVLAALMLNTLFGFRTPPPFHERGPNTHSPFPPTIIKILSLNRVLIFTVRNKFLNGHL